MNTKDALYLLISSRGNGHFHNVIRFSIYLTYCLITVLLDKKVISNDDVEWIIKEINNG